MSRFNEIDQAENDFGGDGHITASLVRAIVGHRSDMGYDHCAVGPRVDDPADGSADNGLGLALFVKVLPV